MDAAEERLATLRDDQDPALVHVLPYLLQGLVQTGQGGLVGLRLGSSPLLGGPGWRAIHLH
eukprot:14257807-Heterocapsa_arctica.AAC.1